MLNAAVIGVGSMGKNHARIYHSLTDVNLIAVSDSSGTTAKKIAETYNTKYYTDYKEMLDNEKIDLVSVVVPTELHRNVAVEVIKRKINVLLEKPIALHEIEAKEIINYARENEVKLMVGHIERFNPAIIELKKRLDNDELGKIYKIDVQRIGPFPGRIMDVGVIIDLSVHDIDIINYIINSPPERIYAETQQMLHPKCEDSVTSLIKYKNGTLATLNINFLSPKKTREISVFGEKGMFKANYLTQELKFYTNPSYNSDKEPHESFESVSEGKESIIPVNKREPLLCEIETFVDCIKNNEKCPIGGDEALKVLITAKKLEKSSKLKKIIIGD